MDEKWLLEALLRVIPLVLSLSVHEWAHAYSAFRLGDDTAERQGRLTLNPIPHIDPIGTLLLPLIGVPFGWARPVPVNPLRFTRKLRMRTGMMITAAAGPFSNVVLALVCVVALGLLWRFEVQNEAVSVLLKNGFFINVLLAFFNMLPIPPLDGSRIADGVMPERLRAGWERFGQYAPLVLIGVILLGQTSHGGGIFRWPIELASQFFMPISYAIATF